MSILKGPRGEPGLPPAWLADHDIPLTKLNRVWYRCAHSSRPLVDWDKRATSRFSSPSLPFRTLYLGQDTATGFWETFGEDLLPREPELRTISTAAYGSRIIVEFQLPPDLLFIDLMDAKTLRAVGADGATFKARYAITQPWAQAFQTHRAGAAGLLYESRLNNGAKCLALFERPGLEAAIAARVLHKLEDDAPIRDEILREKISILPPI